MAVRLDAIAPIVCSASIGDSGEIRFEIFGSWLRLFIFFDGAELKNARRQFFAFSFQTDPRGQRPKIHNIDFSLEKHGRTFSHKTPETGRDQSNCLSIKLISSELVDPSDRSAKENWQI